jgi:hypothetical protein
MTAYGAAAGSEGAGSPRLTGFAVPAVAASANRATSGVRYPRELWGRMRL